MICAVLLLLLVPEATGVCWCTVARYREKECFNFRAQLTIEAYRDRCIDDQNSLGAGEGSFRWVECSSTTLREERYLLSANCTQSSLNVEYNLNGECLQTTVGELPIFYRATCRGSSSAGPHLSLLLVGLMAWTVLC
eukprot:NODE_6856_length_494_cov_6.539510_g6690_i0.p1 GENE.NODE_6856_length_494_cov_6.539510_g6690_i0~~NODE_6856_length_494_cov_6.539510_g6690_i0.p1  ORF type:complete len:147 (+),score=41.48 NODE_6856_length_494_cov_6.539510_g6690_i0:33-443(+)